MTRDEFIKAYCERSNTPYARLREYGRFAVPCKCGDGACDGWQMTHIFLGSVAGLGSESTLPQRQWMATDIEDALLAYEARVNGLKIAIREAMRGHKAHRRFRRQLRKQLHAALGTDPATHPSDEKRMIEALAKRTLSGFGAEVIGQATERWAPPLACAWCDWVSAAVAGDGPCFALLAHLGTAHPELVTQPSA